MEKLEQLEDDFFVTKDNVERVLSGFSVNILTAVQTYSDYHKGIMGIDPTPMNKYVVALLLEDLSR